jgi:malonate decarboxylase delta subunit
MLTLKFAHAAKRRLSGKKDAAIIGVVASGNLEVLLERVLPGAECEVDIATPITGPQWIVRRACCAARPAD